MHIVTLNYVSAILEGFCHGYFEFFAHVCRALPVKVFFNIVYSLIEQRIVIASVKSSQLLFYSKLLMAAICYLNFVI
jgi:hypothetical protein